MEIKVDGIICSLSITSLTLDVKCCQEIQKTHKHELMHCEQMNV